MLVSSLAANSLSRGPPFLRDSRYAQIMQTRTPLHSQSSFTQQSGQVTFVYIEITTKLSPDASASEFQPSVVPPRSADVIRRGVAAMVLVSAHTGALTAAMVGPSDPRLSGDFIFWSAVTS